MRSQAEANLSALIESTKDLIWSVDLRSRLITFNRAFKEYFEKNFGCQLAPGMSVWDLHPPEFAHFWLPLYDLGLSGKTFSTEYTIADGRTLEISFSPMMADGETSGVSVFGKDISERRQAMQALQESEARSRNIFEKNGTVMLLVEPEKGEIVAANGAAVQYYGYSREQLIGMSVDRINTLPSEEVAQERQKALSEERTFFNFRHRLASGEEREVEVYSSPVEADGKRLLLSVVHDVTERKQAMQALRESEARFRNFFAQNSSAMILMEPETGEVVAANRAAAVYFGVSQEEATRVVISQIILTPLDEWAANRQSVMRGERNVFCHRIRLASGEEREVEVYSSPFEINGRLLLFSIVHDITDRKRAEAALREKEESLREAQSIAGLGSYQMDLHTGLWRGTEVLRKIFGIDESYLCDVDGWAAVIDPADRGRMTAYFAEEVVGKGQAFDNEYRIVRQSDGAKRWVHGLGRLEFDEQGRPVRMLGTIQDITERHRTEILLRDSEERYRATFEQVAVGIVHASFEGRILRCNAHFADLLGYTVEEITGKTIRQISAPEDFKTTVAALKRLRHGNASSEILEKRYLRKNGSLCWAKLTISQQCDGEGHPIHFIALVEDINEHKAVEQRLAATQETLRLSEDRYRSVFETTPDAVLIVRQSDGVILDANQSFLESLGFSRNEVIGRTTHDLGLWVKDADQQRFMDAMTQNSMCRDMEVLSRRRDGGIFWMRLSAAFIVIEGTPCRLVVAKEVTEVKMAAEAMQRSEERYRTAFQTSLDAININRLDDDGYIDCNQAFLDVFGYEREEVIGKTSLQLGIWTDKSDQATMVELVRRNGSYRGLEVQFRKKNGDLFWGVMSASAMEVDGVLCVLSVTSDLSEVKAAKEEIRSLAYFDPLTGLPNRRMLLERLRQTLAASNRSNRLHALLLIDLDNLKTLNDSLGHHAGDLLLKEVAQRILACARESDTVSRLGSDEFVALLEDLSEVAEEAAAQAKAAGERILASVSQPYMFEDRESLSSASIGIVVFGDGMNATEDILQQADIALHLAKAAGRNTMRFFSPDLQAAVNARASLEEDLRRAIKKRQFMLYYQPLVSRGHLMGAEALIRWQHPKRGLVRPDEFIPLAEETGLILPIGDWVLETACAQLATWASREQSAHLTLAVNISALQFRQQDFVTKVMSALERSGANPKHLKLELTESILVENIEEVIAKMTELKAYGLSFSLDDFGTGYSSLAYLKRLPLDLLKIDRAFVRDMMVDMTSGAIAQTIISLGRAMGLSVIAEGVESEAQRGFLADLGCNSYQGYLFSPPLPLKEFEAFI
jgi:diguanylate cyclase (GGDEF)-like protein/PAS domain S-box-containing protein